jgi:ABC-type sulfate transport system permease subunit
MDTNNLITIIKMPFEVFGLLGGVFFLAYGLYGAITLWFYNWNLLQVATFGVLGGGK